MHEDIVNNYEARPPVDKPTLTLVAGGGASGKSRFMDAAINEKPEAALVSLDLCRASLPENERLQGTGLMGLTHEEAGDVRDAVLAAGVGHSNDVVLEAVGSRKLAGQLSGLEKSGYEVKVVYVHRPTDEAIEMAKYRAEHSPNPENKGRVVPTQTLIDGHAKARDALGALSSGRRLDVWDVTGVKRGSDATAKLVYQRFPDGSSTIHDAGAWNRVVNGEEPKLRF